MDNQLVVEVVPGSQYTEALAAGLTPRAVMEKMASIQMIDVHLATTDGRHLILSRYTEPEADPQPA
jgi:hypothetical protein